MIQVRENLLKGNSGTYKITARNTGEPVDNNQFKVVVIPTELREDQEYTFCLRAKQYGGSGKFSTRVTNLNYTSFPFEASLQANEEKVYFNFIYRPGITKKLLVYSDIHGNTRGVGMDFKDIILVEGHFERGVNEIVYLPHKEDVKSENQAIFPVGGGITKSTLYRGYKGVSLC